MRHSYKNINKNKKLIIIRHSKKPPIDLIIAEKHCFLCKKNYFTFAPRTCTADAHFYCDVYKNYAVFCELIAIQGRLYYHGHDLEPLYV